MVFNGLKDIHTINNFPKDNLQNKRIKNRINKFNIIHAAYQVQVMGPEL